MRYSNGTTAMTDRSPSGGAPPARSRTPLYLALGLVAAAGIATIPWQRKQWDEAQRLKQVANQEARRLQEIQQKRSDVDTIEAKLKESPDNLEVRLEAARAFIARGDSRRGSRLLQEVDHQRRTDPQLKDDAALAGALSSLFERIGWQDKALELALDSYRLDPNSVEALMRVAFLEAVLGRQKRCQEHVAEAVRRAPDSAEPHLALALVHDQVGGLPAAEQELKRALTLRPDDWHIQLLLARNYLGQKRYDDALAVLDSARQKAPTEASLVAARTDALLEKVDRASAKTPAGIQAALDSAQEYLRLVPQSPEAHFKVGKALALKGDETGAIAMLEEVYKRQPDFARVRTTLGMLLARHGQRERAARLMADDSKALDDGNEFHRLITATGQQSENRAVHREMALHCEKFNRIPRAIIEWSEVLRLAPGDPEATAGIARCKKIRGDLYP